MDLNKDTHIEAIKAAAGKDLHEITPGYLLPSDIRERQRVRQNNNSYTYYMFDTHNNPWYLFYHS